jgi:hypothetical protein
MKIAVVHVYAKADQKLSHDQREARHDRGEGGGVSCLVRPSFIVEVGRAVDCDLEALDSGFLKSVYGV